MSHYLRHGVRDECFELRVVKLLPVIIICMALETLLGARVYALYVENDILRLGILKCLKTNFLRQLYRRNLRISSGFSLRFGL